MDNPFLRNEMLWGAAAQQRLARSHVILFGLGGVGSYTAECLARSGIGELTLVDQDTVSLTNLNRQLEALHSTLGKTKAQAVAERLRDINPDVCGWLTLDGTAIDYPVVQGESNFTYLNTDVYGSFALAGSIFLDVDCDADFSGRYSLLYGHHMENGRMFGDLDKYKDGAFFRQNTTGTLTLPGGSYRLEVLACLVVPASEQAIFAPGKWRSDAGGLLPFVEENALQMDAQALRALEEEPEGAQFLAMATCSGEYTDARTVVLARMEPMSDLQNGKEESLS